MVLFDEVRQERHHPRVAVAAAVSSSRQEAVLVPVASALVGREAGEHQGLVGQRGQAALQVQQVGAAAADSGVGVRQFVQEGAGVGRTAQSPLVQIQQRQVTAVVSQRVDDAGGGSGWGETAP